MHHRDTIFERNYISYGSCAMANGGCQNGFAQRAYADEDKDVTLRNNICDMTGPQTYRQCIFGAGTGAVEVYNNSMYSPGNSRALWSGAGSGCLAENNLAWDASENQMMFESGTCPSSAGNADADGGESGVSPSLKRRA
ncbi:MAG: hypothetical protein P8X90_09090 [Desulfobacterales bacterium]